MRLLPAVGLVLLAPLVAEFLLGNLPITALTALFLLAPFYGGGALLIREVARRTGRGWPTILLLGVAFGLVEEGLTTQSLFNPGYAGADLLAHGVVPWAVAVLTLHVAGSIATPIALVETISGREGPWLRTPGLVVTAVLFVLGAVGTTLTTLATDPFVAPVGDLVGAGVAAAVVAVAAFVLPGRGRAVLAPPHPLVLTVLVLVAGAAYEAVPLDWRGAVVVVALWVVGAVVVSRLARHERWSQAHVLALAAGWALTYAWHAFPETPVLPSSLDLVGNVVFAVGAVVLIGVAAARLRRGTRPAQAAPIPSSRTS